MLPLGGANNFFDPLDSPDAPSLFYPGNHPDAVVVVVPYDTEESWYLGINYVTATPASFGGSKTVSSTCSATMRPATLSFTAPGNYTHQFLGQIDAGPAADVASKFSIVALAGGQNVTVDNLSYVPNDAANPTHSLNPNSVYGDVAVNGSSGTATVLLELMNNGQVLVDGVAVVKF